MKNSIKRCRRENDRQTARFNDCADVLGERQCELCNDIADSWDSSSDPSVLTAEKVSAI